MPMPLQTLRTKESNQRQPCDMDKVAAIILGGGVGSRLYPLTLSRCKPAICFGGRYRLVDVPISNALNSGCKKMFLVTQFLSTSLHQHLFRTYGNDLFSNGTLEILTAEQKPTQQDWFQGTADAVRQNIEYLIDLPVDYYLILSGDQLYSMDFRKFVSFGIETDADLIIAGLKIAAKDAPRMGIMKTDENYFITDFVEKPQNEALLMRLRQIHRGEEHEKPYLASMGIYLFKRNALLSLLQEHKGLDFGKHLIPAQLEKGPVAVFPFDSYWEDIGTIGSFHEANMELTKQHPSYNLYDEKWPLHNIQGQLPGPKIVNTVLDHTILNEGSQVFDSKISHSIIGPRTIISRGCDISWSYLMGNDFYTPPQGRRFPEKLAIDENCTMRKTIVDRNVSIGKNVQLINRNQLSTYDPAPHEPQVYIRDGIIVVPAGVSIPDHFVL